MRDRKPPAPESAGYRLIVYGTNWCPVVRRSRRLLDTACVSYRYVDLDEDAAATTLVRQLQHGQRRTPTLQWPDETFLVEPDDEQLLAHLRARHHTRAGTSH